METINNTEPMPSVPQGANGQWVWDGYTTARHRSVDGQEWLLKGAWRWVEEQKQVQAPLAKQPIDIIVKQFKPTRKQSVVIESLFNKFCIALGAIIAVTLITLITL